MGYFSLPKFYDRLISIFLSWDDNFEIDDIDTFQIIKFDLNPNIEEFNFIFLFLF